MQTSGTLTGMIWSAGDLGIEIDIGLLYKAPGAILQRIEAGEWFEYLVGC